MSEQIGTFYGYGIVDRNLDARPEFAYETEEEAKDFCKLYNTRTNLYAPYRVVQLFWKEVE